MNDVIEVSYTGDLLAHRRCPRAWAYEKHAGFHPYEQVQAMEGRLIHHAMEWLTQRFKEDNKHATQAELKEQLLHYFRVLWARGMRTTFATKDETIERILGYLFPKQKMHKTVKAAIEGAMHTEYELRTVRKLIKAKFAGKSRLLLTGILDLVVQAQEPLTYERVWRWESESELTGNPEPKIHHARPGDVEIWDYKGTKAGTPYKIDYVRQLLTYAALYRERTGELPKRCVLFFVNEQEEAEQLLAVPIDENIIELALEWTMQQVKELRQTMLEFELDPLSVDGGDSARRSEPVGKRVSDELKKQCTACSFRFDCREYREYLGTAKHPDIRLDNVMKN